MLYCLCRLSIKSVLVSSALRIQMSSRISTITWCTTTDSSVLPTTTLTLPLKIRLTRPTRYVSRLFPWYSGIMDLLVVCAEPRIVDEDGHSQYWLVWQVLERSNDRWVRPWNLGRGTVVGEASRSSRARRGGKVKGFASMLTLNTPEGAISRTLSCSL